MRARRLPCGVTTLGHYDWTEQHRRYQLGGVTHGLFMDRDTYRSEEFRYTILLPGGHPSGCAAEIAHGRNMTECVECLARHNPRFLEQPAQVPAFAAC